MIPPFLEQRPSHFLPTLVFMGKSWTLPFWKYFKNSNPIEEGWGLTIKTSEKQKHIISVILMLLLLTLNRFYTFLWSFHRGLWTSKYQLAGLTNCCSNFAEKVLHASLYYLFRKEHREPCKLNRFLGACKNSKGSY